MDKKKSDKVNQSVENPFPIEKLKIRRKKLIEERRVLS